MLDHVQHQRINVEPSLTFSDWVEVTDVTLILYSDIRAELAEAASLTPGDSELLVLANKYPAPDEWWEEEG